MDVLADVVGPDLKAVFCGTAVGKQSAARGAYYAGDGNKFWSVLYAVGLTDRRLAPAEFRELLRYRIGLTDLAKRVSGSDAAIKPSDFDCDRLRRLVLAHKPFALAFTSKTAGGLFFGKNCAYGRHPETIGPTRVYVLPSTSGLARRYWSEKPWQAFADELRDR